MGVSTAAKKFYVRFPGLTTIYGGNLLTNTTFRLDYLLQLVDTPFPMPEGTWEFGPPAHTLLTWLWDGIVELVPVGTIPWE